MKWTKVDPKTGEPPKLGCNSFMPHDYSGSNGMYIENHSFEKRHDKWVLRTGTERLIFGTLKAAKAYAETH